MTRVALECGAVNLSQGYPDFDPPPEVREAAAKAVLEGPNQYAVTWGLAELREAIAENLKSRYTPAFDWLDPDLHHHHLWSHRGYRGRADGNRRARR